MSTFVIVLAIVAAVIAWMVIPSGRKPPGPGNPPEAMPPVFSWPNSPQPMGPFAASVEEKMAVVESELRSRQNDKYRKAVIEEVAELVSSGSGSKAK